MPVARIVTRIPKNAASLADYLAQQGYDVEMVAPDEAVDAFADLEITFETCRNEQALERAADLALSLNADIVVASGAIPEGLPQPAPVEPEAVAVEEAEPQGPSWFDQRSQAMRAAMGDWRERGKRIFVASNSRLSSDGRAWLHKGLNASREAGMQAGKWAHEAWLRLRQALGAGAATLQATAQRTWSQAAERIRTRALQAQQRREGRRREQERLMQEIASLRQDREGAAALEAANLRAKEERFAVVSEPADTVSEDMEELVSHEEAPVMLRPVVQRRSPLIAYTRNRGRDWKMAFVGAAVASAAIMFVSLSVQHKPLPQDDVQQKLPFGAAASPPAQPPTLMIPVTTPKKLVPPPELPVSAKKATAVPKPQVKPAPETQVENHGQYFEEVVVRHYPTHQSAKARSGEDGVKRISDLE